MKSVFDEDYFKRGNYVDYLSRSEKYKRLARDVHNFLGSIKMVKLDNRILDYGCAVGFLLDGLKEFGYSNLFGYDISEWAERVFTKNHNTIKLNGTEDPFYITFFLDVLEHIKDEDIIEVIKKINSEVIIVRIPISIDGGLSYHLEISNNDITHINCKEKWDWVDFFSSLGYNFFLELNLSTIYSTDGVFCAILFKQTWRKNV